MTDVLTARWHGYLTRGNIDAVASRLRHMLCTGIPHTRITSVIADGFEPIEVKHQLATSVSCEETAIGSVGIHGRLTIRSPGRSLIFTTTAENQRQAAKQDVDERTYITIDLSVVEVEHHDEEGRLVVTTFTLERPARTPVSPACTAS